MCILKCILKHRILRKIRATFLSLSEEKKATSAGLKRLRRSRRPLAYSLLSYWGSLTKMKGFGFTFNNVSKRCRWNCKQCNPRSDSSSRISLIWICIACFNLYVPILRIFAVNCVVLFTFQKQAKEFILIVN